MPRRPIEMKPMGDMQGRFRPQRVGSSTCPIPQVSNDQAIGGLADELSVTSTDFHLSGPEYHIAEMLGQGSITPAQAYEAMHDLNS